MIAVSIVGFKKTGKTTLAVALGEELARRGIRAAAAKFTSHEGVDVAGTDSDRLRKAYGSAALLAPDGAAVFREGRQYLPDLLPVLSADVLVVEGGKELGWLPRILMLRSVADAGTLDQGLALASYGEVEGRAKARVRLDARSTDGRRWYGYANIKGYRAEVSGSKITVRFF